MIIIIAIQYQVIINDIKLKIVESLYGSSSSQQCSAISGYLLAWPAIRSHGSTTNNLYWRAVLVYCSPTLYSQQQRSSVLLPCQAFLEELYSSILFWSLFTSFWVFQVSNLSLNYQKGERGNQTERIETGRINKYIQRNIHQGLMAGHYRYWCWSISLLYWE